MDAKIRRKKNLEQRLREENENLRKKLEIEGDLHYLEEMDPELENIFLKQIITFHAMEDGPKIEIRTLFPIEFEFPPSESLSEDQLFRKLAEIDDVLSWNDIHLEFNSECPDRLVYGYVLEQILSDKIAVSRPPGFIMHYTGCDGYCPECFQRQYCKTGLTWSDEDDGGE